MRYLPVLALSALLASVSGCASSTAGDCDPNVAACSCSGPQDCPVGFDCLSDICVATGDGGAGADAGASSDAGPSFDAGPSYDAKPTVGFGEPCMDKSDCTSNICIFVGIGGICTETCVAGSCPMDFGCVGVFGAIDPGSVADVCVPESNQLCTTCTQDTECSLIGNDKCIEYEPGKSFCGRDCSVAGCPMGYDCNTVNVDGTNYEQCQPTSGACDCTMVNMGTTEGCDITTPFGTCQGTRTCGGASGWGSCEPPSTTDAPDGSFTDDNCDGIDGDIDGGIFVSDLTGNDTATCGLTYMDPCATINRGIIRAIEASRGEVYIQRGDYNEVVVMVNAIDLYGGYDLNWQRDTHTLNDHRVTITGGLDNGVGGDNQYLTIRAHSLIVNTVIADLTINGPNASGTVGGRGRSSYAVHVDSGLLTLERVTIVGGNAANGSNGSTGSPTTSGGATSGMNGGNGGGASEFITDCNSTSHGARGSRGTNSCSGAVSTRSRTAGYGGYGGEMDGGCSCLGVCVCNPCTATSGDPGGNASYTNGLSGVGGGGGSGGDTCSTPAPPGRNGYVQNGSRGLGATNNNGELVGSYWYAFSGSGGSTGQHGGGGGGGGGSGGCDIGTDSYGAGGGGGGAGGCAATSGGGGGGGGGGSFGIFAVNSANVTASDCTITRGNGGKGGNGGAGGHGQSGGSGGNGGLADGDSKAGGDGGDGAHGGHGGGGGGGAGGLSVGVFNYSSTVNQSCSINGGSAGTRGDGGLSAPNAPAAERDGFNGTNGSGGSVRSTDVCGNPSSC